MLTIILHLQTKFPATALVTAVRPNSVGGGVSSLVFAENLERFSAE